MLEHLESRVLLATVTWDGGAGTDAWHDPMNWSADTLPTESDDVVINVGGSPTIEFTTGAATVRSINSYESFSLTGGTLTVIDDWIQREDLTLADGAIDATLVVQEDFSWSGGALRGDKTTVTPDAAVTITGNVTLQTLLVNFGMLTWSNGEIVFNNGAINNQGDASFIDDTIALDGGGDNLIANNAILNRKGANTQTVLDVAFSSGGDTRVSGGLRLNGVSSFLGGTLVIDLDAIVRIFGDGSRFGVNHTLTVPGVLMFAGGEGHVTRAAIADLDELVVANGADLSFDGSGATIDRLDLDGILRDVDGELLIRDRCRIFGGALMGDGAITIDTNALMAIEGGVASQHLDVEIYGTFILKSGIWSLHAVDVTNYGANMFLRAGAFVGAEGDWSWINNEQGAIITKHTGAEVTFTGASDVAVARISNRGDIRVNDGDLIIQRGGTSHDGATLKAASGAQLRIEDMQVHIFGDVVGDGALHVGQTGKAVWHTEVTGIRELIVDGVVSLQGADAIIDRIDLRGVIKDAGDLLITERLRAFSGEIRGDGTLEIGQNAQFTIDGDVALHLDTMTNHGDIIAKNGQWSLHQVEVTNHAHVFIRAADLRAESGQSSLINDGAIIKHTQATSRITGDLSTDILALHNLGDVHVFNGELQIRRGGYSTGVLEVGAAATLGVHSRPFVIENGSVIGDGTMTFGASAGGSAWRSGDITISVLHMSSSLTLETDAAKVLDVDTLLVKGDFVWADGDLEFGADEVIVRPGGRLMLLGVDAFTLASPSDILVEETARLLQLSNQTIDFADSTLMNLGTVKARAGSLTFNAGAVQNLDDENALIGGTWVVEGGGVLDFGENVDSNLATTITLRGATSNFVSLGALSESKGPLYISEAYDLEITGDFTNKGLIDFNEGGRLSVDGTFISGAGAVTRIDVSDVVDGVIDVTGQVYLGGTIIASWSMDMPNPPMFIKLVTGAAVIDQVLNTTFNNVPPGHQATLNFGNPTKARIRLTQL